MRVLYTSWWNWYWFPYYDAHEDQHQTEMYHRQVSWLCFTVQWDLRDYSLKMTG